MNTCSKKKHLKKKKKKNLVNGHLLQTDSSNSNGKLPVQRHVT